MQYVTGSNQPGYLPESDPSGPWNSWRDSVADLGAMIESEADELTDHAAGIGGEEGELLRVQVSNALASATRDIAALVEDPRGCDVIFMGRAYFIRPAE